MKSTDGVDQTTQKEAAKPPRRPSALFLIVLNALLFVLWWVSYATDLMLMMTPDVVFDFVAGSGVWQFVWFLLNRRYRFHHLVRSLGFVAPVIGWLALVALLHLIPPPPPPVNQQFPAVSATGAYQARVTAEERFWIVEIQNSHGETLYKQPTDFVSHLNVYWIWDNDDRLWLYNSDDGWVHYWHAIPEGEWEHVIWDSSDVEKPDPTVDPPNALFPERIRELREENASREEASTAFHSSNAGIRSRVVLPTEFLVACGIRYAGSILPFSIVTPTCRRSVYSRPAALRCSFPSLRRAVHLARKVTNSRWKEFVMNPTVG